MPRALTMEEKVAKAESKKEAGQVRTSVDRGERPRRGVFNGTSGKLQVHGTIPGYHMHIFNDTAGRIEEALSAGYEFVSPDEIGGVATNVTSKNTDLGDRVRFLVGSAEGGNPLYAYLMKIRQEWFDEDQTELQGVNDRVDTAIRAGQNTKAGSSSEGFYVPREGIKMNRN